VLLRKSFLGRNAEAYASVESHGLNLNVEPFAAGVLPRAADARPDGVVTFLSRT
jgi:hypothetical protein